MWPNLIPGDILRAEEKNTCNLKEGMIAVFPGKSCSAVHRINSVSFSGSEVHIISSGDRSGTDRGRRTFKCSQKLPVVTGVLRRGRYVPVGKIRIRQWLAPKPVVRIWCAIVRKILW